jgi:hypothetical protein
MKGSRTVAAEAAERSPEVRVLVRGFATGGTAGEREGRSEMGWPSGGNGEGGAY